MQIESKIKVNYYEFCACENSPRVEVACENKGVQTIENQYENFC